MNTEKTSIIIKIIISLIFLTIAFIHIFNPDITIDSITLTLLLLSFLPWLAPLLSQYVKSIELPGGTKIELKDLKKTYDRIMKDQTPTKIISSVEDNFIEQIGEQDPNIAVAYIGIEIEKRLRNLAEINGIETKKKGASRLLRELSRKKILSSNVQGGLSELIYFRNQAVHGEAVTEDAAKWVMDFAPNILSLLDEIIEQTEKNYLDSS